MNTRFLIKVSKMMIYGIHGKVFWRGLKNEWMSVDFRYELLMLVMDGGRDNMPIVLFGARIVF